MEITNNQEFEWDANKNKKNTDKHQIDFETAKDVFYDPDKIIQDVTKPEYNETRFKAIGKIIDRIHTVVFTWREKVIRIISARKANQPEQDDYNDINNKNNENTTT